ncbi:MAG: nitroreductase family protein [Oscillospiraceae bacterium]|nr:nitroreductase family protein [Oscillospiraceae bacterium]
MKQTFWEALAHRRSCYSLDKNITVTPEHIRHIVEQAVTLTPSAFNSQSARTVVLFGGHHETLWRITADILRGLVPPAAFPKTAEKLQSFAAAAGTILFFEEMNTVEDLQTRFPAYKDNFPVWSQQANGMLQSNIWVALEADGLGASLQHYNPLIDEAVTAQWDLPKSWKLIAQMPFGRPTAQPGDKDTLPATERVKVFQ